MIQRQPDARAKNKKKGDRLMINVLETSRWGRRHAVVAMCFLAMFIAYSDRVNISVAAVAMFDEFHWSETVKAEVLAAFFIGYLIAMIPAGLIAARIGGLKLLGWAVIWWSVFTFLTPWAAGVSFSMLIAARIALGIGEAAIMPAVYELLGRWVPAGERSRAITRFLSGIPMGQIVGFAVTGWLTGQYGWPMSFYVFGTVGVIWAAYWLTRFHNDPARDHRIAADERLLLDAHTNEIASPSHVTAWSLVRCKPVLAVFVAHFTGNWLLYTLLAWLPSYFHAMGLDYASTGIYSAAPWLAAFATGNLTSILADRAITRGVPVILIRKLTLGVSFIGAALCLLLLRDVHSPTAALTIVCIATACYGCSWSGFAPNLLDIAPRHAAKLMGISNFFATIPGAAGVYITGWLLQRTGSYAPAFVLTSSIVIGGALFFLAYASAKRVDVG